MHGQTDCGGERLGLLTYDGTSLRKIEGNNTTSLPNKRQMFAQLTHRRTVSYGEKSEKTYTGKLR